jgi:hypothetical protein
VKIRNDVPKEKWWVKDPQTARHIYLNPTNSVPGMVLFGLIALLGCLAIVVAARNVIRDQVLHREDALLGGVGLFCCVLAAFQFRRLLRDD